MTVEDVTPLHHVAYQLEQAGDAVTGPLPWQEIEHRLREWLLNNMRDTTTLAEFNAAYKQALGTVNAGLGPLGAQVWGVHTATSAAAVLRAIARLGVPDPDESGQT